jgi:phosphatidylinositol alpha-1,6-mannosyltransferase
MKVLFITRKYPPSIGGMQRYSYDLITNFDKKTETQAITWGGSQIALPFFLGYAFFKSLYLLASQKADLIHLGDALLAPLGLILKKTFRVPVVATAHGLDVTLNNAMYQGLVLPSLARLDQVICVSQNTQQECLKRGIDKNKCTFIPNGINLSRFKKSLNQKQARERIAKKFGLPLENKKILLSVGRLVKRKGLAWFARQVFPQLMPETIWLIAGEGEEKEKIQQAIQEKNLIGRVFLLGQVREKELQALYQATDLFVMPNIKVKGDVEGFGLTLLEASANGLPAVASKLEGIQNAVTDGANGVLVESSNAQAFRQKINQLLRQTTTRKALAQKAKRLAREKFAWKKIIGQYYQTFERVQEATQ